MLNFSQEGEVGEVGLKGDIGSPPGVSVVLGLELTSTSRRDCDAFGSRGVLTSGVPGLRFKFKGGEVGRSEGEIGFVTVVGSVVGERDGEVVGVRLSLSVTIGFKFAGFFGDMTLSADIFRLLGQNFKTSPMGFAFTQKACSRSCFAEGRAR